MVLRVSGREGGRIERGEGRKRWGKRNGERGAREGCYGGPRQKGCFCMMIPQQAEIDLIVDERIQFLKAWHHEKITRRDLMDIKNSHLATDLEKGRKWSSNGQSRNMNNFARWADEVWSAGNMSHCVSKSKPKKRIPFHPSLTWHTLGSFHIHREDSETRQSERH